MAPSHCQVAKQLRDRYVQAQHVNPASERFTGAVKAGFLANLRTPQRAFFGNAAHGLMRIAQHETAAGLDFMKAIAKHVASDRRIPVHEYREVVSGLDMDGLKALRRGFKGGFSYVPEAVRATRDLGWTTKRVLALVEQLSARLESSGATTGGNVIAPQRVIYRTPWAQAASDFIYATPELMDRPFVMAAYDHSIYLQAKLAAVREGLTGAELKARSAHWQAEPTVEMSMRALEDATFATFKNPTTLGRWGARMKSAPREWAERADRVAKDAGRSQVERDAAAITRDAGRLSSMILDAFIIPFTNVPSSWLGQSVGYLPGVGALSPRMGRFGIGRSQIGKLSIPHPTYELGRPYQVAQILAKQSVGVAGFYLGMELRKQGRISLASSKNEGDREVGKALHQPTWAIKFGDHWVPAAWLAPVMTPVFAGAIYADKMRQRGAEKSGGALAGEAAGDVSAMLMQQHYLENLQRALNVGQGDRTATSMTRDLAPVPPLMRQLAQVTDPTVRNPQNPAQVLMEATPGLSHLVPAAKDVMGREIRRDALERASSIAAPMTIRREVNDPVLKEMQTLGVGASMPSRTVQSRTGPKIMPEDVFDALVEARGRTWNDKMHAKMLSAQYRTASPAQRAKMLEEIKDRQNLRARRRVVRGMRMEERVQNLVGAKP